MFRIFTYIYLGVSAFVAVFSMVYEHFGKGVRSNAMVYAFLYPLILGAVICLFFSLLPQAKRLSYGRSKAEEKLNAPGAVVRMGANLYHSGVATLTMGSIMYGVIEIFGTTDHLTTYYYIVGIGLCVVGFLATLTAYLMIPSGEMPENRKN